MTAPAAALRIHWVVEGVERTPGGSCASVLASNRFRAIIPAQALADAGHTVELMDARQWRWPGTERPDAVVLGKLLPGEQAQDFPALAAAVRSAAAAARADGVPVLADFCDDHFDHPLFGDHWRRTAALASLCTAGSDAMAAAVRRHTRQPVVTVSDPLSSPAGVPRVFRKLGGGARLLGHLTGAGRTHRLKIAWYGNPGSWPALQDWARQLAPLAAQQPFLLWAVTRPSPAMEDFVVDFNARHAPGAAIELVPWSEETQWSVVADADLVLLPSDPSDPRMMVKSSNRLTDALHAARFVVASPVPAYVPFGAFATLTHDPLGAVRAYLAEPEAHLARIVQGQTAALMAAAPAVIAQHWAEAIVQAREAAHAPAASGNAAPAGDAPPAPPLRLNLGCGDKILPGYVNVDVVASRRGQKPDVLCDLHDLSGAFASDSADEVMAIHVVEHFWRWEVEAILTEWVRVLKPGGRMVLECPNLISACEAFLQDPDAASQADQRGQQTMWVFYGDPSWKDPYMIHRWGYTPASLGRLMQSVGLVRVRQEPAQYKMREPRDMRLTGEKPVA